MTEKEIILSPSILAGDHANLENSVRIITETGLRWVHIDIMDGNFVPNLTFGPQTIIDLRKNSQLFFDTHLMLSQPQNHVEAFAKAGSDLISIHIEPEYPVRKTLKYIRDLGCKNGIVINPDTSVDSLTPYIEDVDLILVMTVQPGFGGQVFREDMLHKIEILNSLRKKNHLNFRLEVDGGINLDTGLKCRQKGCDTLVAGSAFFNANNKKSFAESLIL